MVSDEVKDAKEIAQQMAKFLIENYQGQTLSKVSLRIQYEIPKTKSVMVFELLKQFGINVGWKTIEIPEFEVNEPSSSPESKKE